MKNEKYKLHFLGKNIHTNTNLYFYNFSFFIFSFTFFLRKGTENNRIIPPAITKKCKNGALFAT